MSINRAGFCLAVVALAAACGRTERSPSPSRTSPGGEGGEAGAGGSTTIGAGTSPNEGGSPPVSEGGSGGQGPASCLDSALIEEASDPPRRCKPCPKSLIWRPQNGGVLGSELSCASYRFQEAPCAVELECESDERIDVAEITAALAEPDVNLGRQTYGRQDDAVGDPTVWQIWHAGGPIFVGPPCKGAKDCVDAPQAVLDLLALLQALDAQEAYTSADFCSATCPAFLSPALLKAPCARSSLVCSDVPDCSGSSVILVCESDAWKLR